MTRVVTFIGYRLAGWRGAVTATVMYLIPSVAAMFLLAAFYDRLANLKWLTPAGRGIGAAVVGLLAGTVFQMGRGALNDTTTFLIAVGSFGAALLGGLPAAVVVGIAGLSGIVWLSGPRNEPRPRAGEGGPA